MKKLSKKINIVTVIASTALLIALSASFAIVNSTKAFSNDSNSYADHVPGQVIVWLATDSYSSVLQANDVQDEDNACLRTQENSKINEFLSEHDCTTLACYAGDDETYSIAKNDTSYITVKNPLLNTDTNAPNKTTEIPVQERVVLVKYDESQNTTANIIAQLENNPLVKFAEPNYLGHFDSVGDLTDYQYAYDTEGQGQTHNKAGMNVEGWNGSTPNISGDDKVVAAIIDSGVDTTHPDIPLAGTNGIYDLTQIAPGGQYGYNAAADIQSQQAKDPTDTVGHGTHVAGSVAAKWDSDSAAEDKGVSGAANKCYILPIRIGTDDGYTSIDAYVKATAYIIAAKQAQVNIKVANNSWSEPAPSKTMNENATKTGLAGVISVFASSNDNTNIDIERNTTASFTNNPYVIKVDSTNEKGYKSNFSNYGVRTTDVCAPGSAILSTVPTYDIEQAPGVTEHSQISDTRVLDASDYTMIDDFEQTQKLQYTDLAGQVLSVVGSGDNPKGYKSPHAAIRLASSDGYTVIQGDLTPYIKSNSVNNVTLLLNTDSGKNETDNSVAAVVYDMSSVSPRYITTVATSTAYAGYIPVSFPASKISNLENAKILIKQVYQDENYQTRTVDFYIDNVAMAHVEMPYGYKSGTSMASPACAGITAIVANKFKNESIDKIVARIKAGTNKKDWLADVCYSGGIVDLKRACSTNEVDLDPVVQSANIATETNGSVIAELTGYFLGDNRSTVTINGQTATNVAYTQKGQMDVLTCTFANPITGEAKITVTKTNGKTLTRYFDLGDSSNLLETLPQPPKDDARFDNYYNACDDILMSASDSCIVLDAVSQMHVSYYYKYDIAKEQWSPSDMKANIIDAIGNDCAYAFMNSQVNTLYFAVAKNGITIGLLRYDISNDKVLDYEQFSGSTITNPGWLIIEDDIVYLGNYANNSYDVYSYSYTDKSLTLITSGLNCGLKPKVFKQSDNNYIFIDNGSTDQSSTAEVIADVYNVALDNDGFSSQKSSVQAYPQQAKAYKQDKHIGYAYRNNQIITFGPADFAAEQDQQNAESYAYVSADSFSIDVNTGASSALPKVMQNYKVAKPSTWTSNNIAYTSFFNTGGTIQVAKRVLDVTPTPVPPTPEPEKYSSASTADNNSGLLTFAIFTCIISSCCIVYSCKATRNNGK